MTTRSVRPVVERESRPQSRPEAGHVGSEALGRGGVGPGQIDVNSVIVYWPVAERTDGWLLWQVVCSAHGADLATDASRLNALTRRSQRSHLDQHMTPATSVLQGITQLPQHPFHQVFRNATPATATAVARLLLVIAAQLLGNLTADGHTQFVRVSGTGEHHAHSVIVVLHLFSRTSERLLGATARRGGRHNIWEESYNAVTRCTPSECSTSNRHSARGRR
jgi:hypothetical protein